MSAIPTLLPGRTRAAASRRVGVWLAALAALAFAGAAAAQNSIDNITVSKGSSGRTIVKFDLKQPPANPPAGFSISSPPRIALDFLGTANGVGATEKAIAIPRCAAST